MYPSWSPDGKRLAFMSWRNGKTEIFTMNADGIGSEDAGVDGPRRRGRSALVAGWIADRVRAPAGRHERQGGDRLHGQCRRHRPPSSALTVSPRLIAALMRCSGAGASLAAGLRRLTVQVGQGELEVVAHALEPTSCRAYRLLAGAAAAALAF